MSTRRTAPPDYKMPLRGSHSRGFAPARLAVGWLACVRVVIKGFKNAQICAVGHPPPTRCGW